MTAEIPEQGGDLEAPIPQNILDLYVSTKSALAFDLVRYVDKQPPNGVPKNYHGSVPDFQQELQGLIDAAFRGQEYDGHLPEGTLVGPGFIRGFIIRMAERGYDPMQQRAYLQRIFGEMAEIPDSLLLLHARMAGRVISERLYERMGWFEIHPLDRRFFKG